MTSRVGKACHHLDTLFLQDSCRLVKTEVPLWCMYLIYLLKEKGCKVQWLAHLNRNRWMPFSGVSLNPMSPQGFL